MPLQLPEQTITPSPYVKILGVWLDKHLDFSNTLQQDHCKGQQQLGGLPRHRWIHMEDIAILNAQDLESHGYSTAFMGPCSVVPSREDAGRESSHIIRGFTRIYHSSMVYPEAAHHRAAI